MTWSTHQTLEELIWKFSFFCNLINWRCCCRIHGHKNVYFHRKTFFCSVSFEVTHAPSHTHTRGATLKHAHSRSNVTSMLTHAQIQLQWGNGLQIVIEASAWQKYQDLRPQLNSLFSDNFNALRASHYNGIGFVAYTLCPMDPKIQY